MGLKQGFAHIMYFHSMQIYTLWKDMEILARSAEKQSFLIY